jgi:hypothetical protein
MLGTFVILLVLQIIAAQVQLKPRPLTGIRDQNLLVTCTFPSGTSGIILNVRGADITGIGAKFLGLTVRGATTVEYRYGPLEASDDGAVFECDDGGGNTDAATLDVQVLASISGTNSLYGGTVGNTTVITATVESDPPVSHTILTRDGMVVSDSRIVHSATGVTFSNLQCADAGNYMWTVNNTISSDSVTFEIQVQRAPKWKSDMLLIAFETMQCTRRMPLSQIITVCSTTGLSFSCDFQGINFTITVVDSENVEIKSSSCGQGQVLQGSCIAMNMQGRASTTIQAIRSKYHT